jgi:uncharacterized membrane protein YfcA
LPIHSAIVLFVAGVLGGALNAVAGGGSFVAFPALLFTGVPPIPSNATNCFALWVGTTASGGAYRNRLTISRRVLVPLILISVVGGIAGAILLLKTPAHTFMQVLPWLMLGATLLFAFAKKLTGNRPSGLAHDASTTALFWACVFEFVVSVYGGYFGGGVGIINLAMLAALGMTDIHAMNALKVVLGAVINGVAVVTFIAAHAIYWPQGIVMTIGAILGGYSAAHFSQKLPQPWIRAFVILVGSGMSVYFFYVAYLM